MKHIELDYIVPPSQVVDFPETLGYSGYAYKKNSVCFMNDADRKLNQKHIVPVVTVPAHREHLFTKFGVSFLGPLMARGYPFNEKIDNFTDNKNIRNFCFSSLEDEEVLGFTESIGVI